MIDSNKTIVRIVEAVESLLIEKRISDITVLEICEKAQVSRYTFYKYFKDKYDVSNWRMDQIAENTLYYAGRTITLREAYVMTFYEIKKNKPFFRNTSYDEDYNAMPQFVIRKAKSILLDTIMCKKKMPLSKNMEFQIESFLVAGSYQVKKWIQNGMVESPEEMAEMMLGIVPKEIVKIIDSGIET